MKVVILAGGMGTRISEESHLRLPDNEPFFCTYGDGLADIDLRRLAEFHRDHGRAASITAVVPPGRFGALDIAGNEVQQVIEKSSGDEGTISGGFMVLHPSVLDRVAGDNTPFESEPLESLARDRQLMAFRYTGFWAAMDTMRDKVQLEALWSTGRAPWHLRSVPA